MRIAAISDTHGRISVVKEYPKADVLVIAGDVCTTGKLTQLAAFVRDIKNWPYQKIIFVAGNHDRCLEGERRESALAIIANDPRIIMLRDEAVTIDGVKFYGSPWTPTYGRWAFMRPDDLLGDHVWRFIPEDTDVLITHGPAAGILDRVGNRNPGSNTLRYELDQGRIKLKAHIFGHIHEGRGSMEVPGYAHTYTAYNVSFLDGDYEPYEGAGLTVIDIEVPDLDKDL